jgi:hypothetical protein
MFEIFHILWLLLIYCVFLVLLHWDSHYISSSTFNPIPWHHPSSTTPFIMSCNLIISEIHTATKLLSTH